MPSEAAYREIVIPDKFLPFFRRAIPADIDKLAPCLDEENVREVAITHGHSPEEALANCLYNSSLCFTCIDPLHEPEEPQGMFGLSGPACVFLLRRKGYPALLSERRRVLQLYRQGLDWLLELAGTNFLYNYTVRGPLMKWLGWLGATFVEPVIPSDNDIIPFYFEKRRASEKCAELKH